MEPVGFFEIRSSLSSRKPRGEAVKPWAFLAENSLSHDIVPVYDAARTYFRRHVAVPVPLVQRGNASWHSSGMTLPVEGGGIEPLHD